MSDPIFSSDGKFMWTGSEWIPTPPSSESAADSSINLQDSMMSGNVNIEQNSNDSSSAINLKDSAMSGDINITQNNAEDIAIAMAETLEKMGFVAKQSGLLDNRNVVLDIDQESDIEHLIKLSGELKSQEIDYDPWIDHSLGKAAVAIGDEPTARIHFLQALKASQQISDQALEAHSLWGIAGIEKDEDMKKGYLQQAAKKFSAPVNDNFARCAIFRGLSNIAHAEGDFDKAIYWSSESVLANGGFISDEEEKLEMETRPDMSAWRATNLRSHGRTLLRLNDEDFTPTGDELEEAEFAFSESARLSHALNIEDEATALGFLSMVEVLRGNYSEAESLTMERLLIAQKFGDEWNEQEALYSLVNLKIQTEDYTEAERLLNEMRPSEDVALYWLTLADSLPEADLIIHSERIRQKVTEIITGLGLSFDEWVENL